MNVPEEVNVCIVCPPEVVFVPPVELGETQSDPSVAYEIITIPLHQVHHTHIAAHPAFEAHHHPPHPVFAVPLLPLHDTEALPPPPAPHVPAVPCPLYVLAPPPHAYVTELQDIEFAVPTHPFPPAVLVPLDPTALAPPHPPLPYAGHASICIHPLFHCPDVHVPKT